MTYKLLFIKSSQKEWEKLSSPIKQQFKKKLIERLENPHIVKDRLSGLENCYKIKLRNIGYRMVYQVNDMEITVKIIAVGRRDKSEVYVKVNERLRILPHQ